MRYFICADLDTSIASSSRLALSSMIEGRLEASIEAEVVFWVVGWFMAAERVEACELSLCLGRTALPTVVVLLPLRVD